MIIVRDVFQAKYGKGGDLVRLLQEFHEAMLVKHNHRILEDASGDFFTIVQEIEVESVAEWEKVSEELWSRPEFDKWFERMIPLVESGRREFWRVAEKH